MNSRPLRFLLVSHDRATLRHLTSFLAVLGYEVDQAASFAAAKSAVLAERPDVILLDVDAAQRDTLEECQSLASLLTDEPVYTLLLSPVSSGCSTADLAEAGIDDVLAKPVVYGELLSRIRTAARVLEFDRRSCSQKLKDPLTGWLTEHSFRRQAERRLSEAGKKSRAACVVLELDHFKRIPRLMGETAASEVVRQLSERIDAACEPEGLAARLKEGRFAFLLENASEAEAADWAERLRQTIEAESFAQDDSQLRLTASVGLTAGQGQSAEELISGATQAAHLAKCSGGNCVVRHGQFDREAKAWADLAAPGKLFERTVARDVATPCPVQLSPDQTLAHAVALIRRTGLAAMPVVHAEGDLVGLIRAADLPERPLTADQLAEPISEWMATDVERQEDETSLAALMEFFAHRPETTVVVVHQGRVTGIVTRTSLLALCEPLRSDRFAPDAEFSFGSRYLLVADKPKEEALA